MYNKIKYKIMRVLENRWAEIIVISVFTMCFLSSCGIQFGNYERYKQVHKNNTCSIKEITDELMYYIQEDSFNGGLDSTTVQLYIEKIEEINKELMYTSCYSCENCDEVD
jgi:hypothetical protein